MKITVCFLGQLRHSANRDSVVIEAASGAVLTDVIGQAAAKYDDVFRGIVFNESGLLRPSLMVLYNETPIDKDAPPTLRDGDQITLLTAISGG